MRERILVALCGLGMSCFIATNVIAMSLYPGGTWFGRHTKGHSFWMNFLCDLMQTKALNGQVAPVGSMLARVGSLMMAVAMAAFCLQMARFEVPTRLAGRVTKWAGVTACVLALSIPLVPSDLFRDAHMLTVVGTFIPSLIAVIAALFVCWRTAGISWFVRAMGAITLGAGGLNGILYAYGYAQFYGFVPYIRSPLMRYSLPVLQRISTIALILWMVGVCVHTLSKASAE